MSGPRAAPPAGASFEERLSVFGVPNAKAYAEALFRECFNAPFPEPREDCGLAIPTPPANWRQYVALYRWPDGTSETVGFCNWIKYRDAYLGGGMCVSKTFYRRLPKAHFEECRRRGGIAQIVLEASFRGLADCTAWFGYCGDGRAMAVDLRVGFVPTRHKHVIVKWARAVPQAEGDALVDAVAAIGPF